jgi:hypothetical protein
MHQSVAHPLRSGGLRVAVDDVILGARGFSFSAHTHLWAWRLRALGMGPTEPRWEGFSRVEDDLGHAYLLQGREGVWMHRRWSSGGPLRMAFFPAVAPGATALTFAASPVAISLAAAPPSADPRLPTTVNIGPALVWRLRLPT